MVVGAPVVVVVVVVGDGVVVVVRVVVVVLVVKPVVLNFEKMFSFLAFYLILPYVSCIFHK